MNEPEEGSTTVPQQPPGTLPKGIKVALSAEYAKGLADTCIQGKGMFLDIESYLELQEYIGNMTAMVRLVLHASCNTKEKSSFEQDVHTAMRIANENLDEVESPIDENRPNPKWIKKFIKSQANARVDCA